MARANPVLTFDRICAGLISVSSIVVLAILTSASQALGASSEVKGDGSVQCLPINDLLMNTNQSAPCYGHYNTEAATRTSSEASLVKQSINGGVGGHFQFDSELHSGMAISEVLSVLKGRKQKSSQKPDPFRNGGAQLLVPKFVHLGIPGSATFIFDQEAGLWNMRFESRQPDRYLKKIHDLRVEQRGSSLSLTPTRAIDCLNGGLVEVEVTNTTISAEWEDTTFSGRRCPRSPSIAQ